jgi:hypothetical protein
MTIEQFLEYVAAVQKKLLAMELANSEAVIALQSKKQRYQLLSALITKFIKLGEMESQLHHHTYDTGDKALCDKIIHSASLFDRIKGQDNLIIHLFESFFKVDYSMSYEQFILKHRLTDKQWKSLLTQAPSCLREHIVESYQHLCFLAEREKIITEMSSQSGLMESNAILPEQESLDSGNDGVLEPSAFNVGGVEGESAVVEKEENLEPFHIDFSFLTEHIDSKIKEYCDSFVINDSLVEGRIQELERKLESLKRQITSSDTRSRWNQALNLAHSKKQQLSPSERRNCTGFAYDIEGNVVFTSSPSFRGAKQVNVSLAKEDMRYAPAMSFADGRVTAYFSNSRLY